MKTASELRKINDIKKSKFASKQRSDITHLLGEAENGTIPIFQISYGYKLEPDIKKWLNNCGYSVQTVNTEEYDETIISW